MASSKYKDKDAGVVLSFNGQWISWTHTVVAYGMSIVVHEVICLLAGTRGYSQQPTE